MVFIIAEIGVNHSGDLALAHKLIDAATGADAVKFQTFDAERLEPPGDRRDALARLQMPREWYPELKAHAEDRGLEFVSTPFDPDSLRFLVSIGVRTLKIASGHLTDHGLLRAAADTDCGVILSTGMARTEDVRDALGIVPDAAVLHCVSAYPCPVEDANLRAITVLRQRFGRVVGLSDHTLSTVLPAVAVGLGAMIIEKHLTLDCGMDGPDHKASLNPGRFAEMIANIREAEVAIGDGGKYPRPCEAEVVRIAAEREEHRCAS